MKEGITEVPPAFASFPEWRSFCNEYRAQLIRIIKLAAGLLPDSALAAAKRRLSAALASTVPLQVQLKRFDHARTTLDLYAIGPPVLAIVP